MDAINRRDVVLLMLGTRARGTEEGLNGITRLQKFLYLLEVEEGAGNTPGPFEFVPYKAGPYSSKLYDDLEFLENVGLLASEPSGEATEAEAAEVELSFEELIGDDSANTTSSIDGGLVSPDAYEERVFRLTDAGKARVQQLLKSKEYEPVVAGIRRVKSRFGTYSLNDLLYYVYTKHPEMTTESEIKDKILRRGRRR